MVLSVGFSCIAVGASTAALLAVALVVRALASGEPIPSGRRKSPPVKERS